jgi:hypothetical protein
MELYSSVWHLISAACLLLMGAYFSIFLSNLFSTSLPRSLAIYLWHTFFSMVYLWYALTYGADAIGYFQEASNISVELKFGTDRVIYLTKFLVHGLGLSILGTFLVFNIFGVIGLLAFDASLRDATINKSRYLQCLATVIVFLPSVSFWSSALGKDSLSFMATGLVLWAALRLHRRWLLMAFAIAVMLLVRPHVAGFMMIAWAFTLLISNKLNFFKKLFLLALSTISLAVILQLAFQELGVRGIADARTLIMDLQSSHMESTTVVNVAEMSFPMQIISYMFRPHIFEVNTVFAFAAAIDNIILLYLFLIGGWSLLLNRKSNLGESRSFMLAYALLAWVMFAMTTNSLGIALRQKWMFAPMLIFLLISVIGAKKRRNTNVSGCDNMAKFKL